MYDYMLMYYKSPYTVHQQDAWLTMFRSAHVQYSFEAFVQLYFLSMNRLTFIYSLSTV